MVVDFDEWATTPKDAGLYRQDSWMASLVIRLRRLSTAVAGAIAVNTTQTGDISTLTAATLARTSGTSGITFAPNVANYGSGFQGMALTKSRDGIAYVWGLVQNNSGSPIADGTAILQLPTGFRPPTNTYFIQGNRAGGFARLDLNTSGQIITRDFAWPNADFLWVSGVFPTN